MKSTVLNPIKIPASTRQRSLQIVLDGYFAVSIFNNDQVNSIRLNGQLLLPGIGKQYAAAESAPNLKGTVQVEVEGTNFLDVIIDYMKIV